MNLANTLELLDRPCEAAEPLAQALTFYPGLENRFELELRIKRLRRIGGCEKETLAKDVVEVLLKYNADIGVKSRFGLTACLAARTAVARRKCDPDSVNVIFFYDFRFCLNFFVIS